MKSKIINKLENLVSKENYNKANLIVKRNSSDSNKRFQEGSKILK